MSSGIDGAGTGGSLDVSRSMHRVPTYKRPSCALGVLMTGYLDKWDPQAYVKKVRRRFVVLTHESVHWFKRAAGYDLFGEERGSISLGDIASIEPYAPRRASRADAAPPAAGNGDGSAADAPSGNAFIISTTDFTKRVFVAPTKEEAGRWLSAIQMAMRNRFLYRRETLTGLSFLQEDGATDGASRPRILLLSLLRGGPTTEAGDAAEAVIARNVEWERAVALPPLLGSDRLLLTFVNGATAQLGGAEVIAHATSSSTQGGEERLKARVVGGGLAGSLLVSTTLVPQQQQQQQQESSPATTHGPVVRALLSQPAHLLVPLLAAGGLLAAALASLTDRRTQVCLSSFRQACQELRVGTMVLVAAALTAHALLSLLLRVKAERKAEERAQAERAGAAQDGPALAGIYLEVEDFLVQAPQAAGAAGEEGGGDDVLAQIPQRYIDGCLGDMTEAARRWRLTVEWRRQYGADAILEQPHPFFKLIKEAYPHYFCSTGRDGNPVYIERSGQVQQARLRAAGCGTDELVWHYIYATEFCYKVLHPRETAKTITVFDVEGVGIRDLAGDAFDFLRKSSSLIQEHYVERSVVIMIVNAPSWFSFLWKIIKPMVNERTQKKVRIVPAGRETTEAITEFVDPANIPKRYGGQLSYAENEPDCRSSSPEEVALREHVEAVNKKHGVEFKMA